MALVPLRSSRYNAAMVAAIKQLVTVQQDGRLEIRSPELRAGAHAEVIVLVEPAPESRPPNLKQLEALTALQQAYQLDEQSTKAWIAEVRAERDASGPQE